MKLYFKYIREILMMALPIMVGQVGHILIGVGDTYVAGKFSTNVLAATGVSNSFFLPILVFGIGVLTVVSSLIPREYRHEKDFRLYSTSMSVAFILSIVLMIVYWCTRFLMPYWASSETLLALQMEYVDITAISIVPALLFQAIREVDQGREKVKMANFLVITSSVINVGLNYILVFGYAGEAFVGIKGLAWATVICRTLLFLTYFIFMLKGHPLFKFDVSTPILKRILQLGLPVGSMFFLEVVAFCLIGIMAGKFGAISAATNTLIINFASLTFVLPQSIGHAVAVKVGYAVGSKNITLLKRFIWLGCLISLSIGLGSTLFYLIFGNFVIEQFTSDIEVAKLGISMLMVIAFFQIFDGLQITLAGVLRGMGETKTTFILVLFSYWLVGVPVGLYLGVVLNYSIVGMWAGMAMALAMMAIGMTPCVIKHIRRFDVLFSSALGVTKS